MRPRTHHIFVIVLCVYVVVHAFFIIINDGFLSEIFQRRTCLALSGEQSLELKRLEYQERVKALQLKLKKLEVREKELSQSQGIRLVAQCIILCC